MPRKRLIFTLLHDAGNFMLSRNFRLQRVGNATWLEKNYNFAEIAFAIDELIVLDVTRGPRDFPAFCACLERVTRGCFAPIAAGGGIRSVEEAKRLLRSGADKIVVNSALHTDEPLIHRLAEDFGRQCVVASADLKRDTGGEIRLWIENGTRELDGSAREALARLETLPIGELYLNSMDHDGTGRGYDLALLDLLPPELPIPVILAGGAGNHHHLAAGLALPQVDAVATAHLLNFVGNGLENARRQLTERQVDLATWPDRVTLKSGDSR
jgi:imidazole glycerol-phosphate synthase subunit HisF